MANPHPTGPSFYDDEFTYFDTDNFREYASAIEQIIHAVAPRVLENGATEPGRMTIRAIHAALGDKMRREWTQDAIDSLSSVEEIGVLPSKYRRKLGSALVHKKRRKQDSMRHIFPQTESI